MSFLRRLLGGPSGAQRGEGGRRDEGGDGSPRAAAVPPGDPNAPLSADELEGRLERENLRQEAARLDELQQRQLRYAEHAWTPPAQGGERRADDADGGAAEG